MKEKRLNEIKGVVLIAVSLIILASLVSFNPYDLSFYTTHPNNPPTNLIRSFGAYFAGIMLFLFGWSSYLIPLFILWWGLRFFRNEPPSLHLPRIIGMIVLMVSSGALMGVLLTTTEAVRFSRAGFFGAVSAHFVSAYFGRVGGIIIFGMLILLSVALVTELLISTFLFNCMSQCSKIVSALFRLKKRDQRPSPSAAAVKAGLSASKKEAFAAAAKPKIVLPPEAKEPSAPAASAGATASAQAPKVKIKEPAVMSEEKAKPMAPVIKDGSYQLPSIDLLQSPPPFEARQIKEDLTNNAAILEATLDDFGIPVKVTDIERGPIITRYELEPAPGVKLNRIVALGDDISLAMKAQSVRIVAPIPGKGRVGVEVPNMQSSLVYLKEIFSAPEFTTAKSKLTLALGKDIAGKPVVADLGKMPHLLIAGTTGSGKTVCVNTLILSLLFKASPDELKFMMIDPKMVELAPYNGLPHLLCPVVTESKKAAGALLWVVNEMEERYRLLAEVGARNIEGYNEKKNNLPYIVVVVDEFADLMMVCRDQVESAITRLAQLSRAVGIHLILATQRPSVDVITGVIKANLPARISFKVASKVDSRTVLDMNGADKLLGKGDMLFSRPEESKLTRAQGALITDSEIEKVVDFIKGQAQPVFNEEIFKDQQRSASGAEEDKDDMYAEAVRVVMESNQASVSILQRRLRFGYTRAARIIDMMEQDGLVGPYEGSKPRKILVDRDEWLAKDTLGESAK